jgi:CO dehydrogenase maturation factor
MLVVVEPTARSLGTAEQIKKLAGDINVENIYIVGSKVRNEEDAEFIEAHSPGLPVLGHLPSDERVIEADRKGVAVYSMSPELAQAAEEILDKLEVPKAQEA